MMYNYKHFENFDILTSKYLYTHVMHGMTFEYLLLIIIYEHCNKSHRDYNKHQMCMNAYVEQWKTILPVLYKY